MHVTIKHSSLSFSWALNEDTAAVNKDTAAVSGNLHAFSAAEFNRHQHHVYSVILGRGLSCHRLSIKSRGLSSLLTVHCGTYPHLSLVPELDESRSEHCSNNFDVLCWCVCVDQVDDWYKLDNNSISAVYVLQPVSAMLKESQTKNVNWKLCLSSTQLVAILNYIL